MPLLKKKHDKRKAALFIQRYTKGWMVRCYLAKVLKETKHHETSLRDIVETYRQHLVLIVRRHDQALYFNLEFSELYEYLTRRRHYEEAFDAFTKTNNGVDRLVYSELNLFFDRLNLHPTQHEIALAAKILMEDENFKEYEYAKYNALDLIFHIFPPRGAHLNNTRVSTWLHPLIDAENALNKNFDKKLKLDKCINAVAQNMKKQHDDIIEKMDGPSTEPASSGKEKSKKKKKK